MCRKYLGSLDTKTRSDQFKFHCCVWAVNAVIFEVNYCLADKHIDIWHFTNYFSAATAMSRQKIATTDYMLVCVCVCVCAVRVFVCACTRSVCVRRNVVRFIGGEGVPSDFSQNHWRICNVYIYTYIYTYINRERERKRERESRYHLRQSCG